MILIIGMIVAVNLTLILASIFSPLDDCTLSESFVNDMENVTVLDLIYLPIILPFMVYYYIIYKPLLTSIRSCGYKKLSIIKILSYKPFNNNKE